MKKSTSKLLRKILYMTGTLLTIGLITVFCSIKVRAQGDSRIPMPHIPQHSNQPYTTTQALGIDMDAIDALFPIVVEVTYEDGWIYITDIGAGGAEYIGKTTHRLSLLDGVWTAEIGERTASAEIIHFYYAEEATAGSNWSVTYISGFRDSYIHLIANDNEYTLNAGSHYLKRNYIVGDIMVEDEYRDGVLYGHDVAGTVDGVDTKLFYNQDRELQYISFYLNPPQNGRHYHYYLPSKGWSSDWSSYEAVQAPQGYAEEIDVSYYSQKLPPILTNAHNCTAAPETGVCTVCGERVFYAHVTLADGTVSGYPTLEEAIRAASEHQGSTVRLLADAIAQEEDWFCITKGHFSIHLNGFDMQPREGAHTSILMTGGNLTVLDDSQEPGKLTDLCNVISGTLTVQGGAFAHILPHEEATVYIEGGVFDQHLHYLPENVLISGGSFSSLLVAEGLSLSDILAEDCYFFDKDGHIVRTEDQAPEGGLYTFTSLTVGYHGDADHVGGTASCTAEKICTLCGNAYGTIDADGHSWDNGTLTKEPTCTEKGTKTFTCSHNALHTRTEDIDSLGGHTYDNACDPDCSECGATRTPAAHYSKNADGKCDECGESFKLSGGAVAGIAVGTTALVSTLGFALYWFLIRKTKQP